MADTITILDGLQFTKPDTADIYTCDADYIEAVKTWAISVPSDASGVRVIFNGTYDPDGGRCHVRLSVTKVTGITTLAKTENTQVLEWQTFTPPAVLESGAIDVSAAYQATLHIDIALSSVTINNGVEIIVQMRKEAALDEWTDLTRFIGISGTAFKADFAAEEAAGQTLLSVTNPATAKLDHIGKFIFLEDTATVAQCEIAYLVAQTGD